MQAAPKNPGKPRETGMFMNVTKIQKCVLGEGTVRIWESLEEGG